MSVPSEASKKATAVSDKTVSAASPQQVKTEDSRIFRSTPYEHQSTTAAVSIVTRVGQKVSVGTTIVKKPFKPSPRTGR